MTTLTLRLGDCVAVMQGIPDESVGAVVCDPPYGLEFMGKSWDKLDWTMQGSFAGGGSDRFKSSPPLPSYGGATSENRICRTCKGSERGNDRVGFKRCRCEDPKFPERKLSTNAIGLKIQESHGLWLAQAYRVLRPGGSIKVFAATRTQHRLTAAIEAVGFINIGVEAWAYGSGFPKSRNIALTIDKQAGALKQRGRAIPVAGLYQAGGGKNSVQSGEVLTSNAVPPYEPLTDDAKTWNGWGTNLKPAWEPFITGRKPLP